MRVIFSTILVSRIFIYSLIFQLIYPKFCAVIIKQTTVFLNFSIFHQMYFKYVQILRYSTIFWKLVSLEMRHNSWLDLLKPRWISLFLFSCSAFDFLYTFVSLNLTFFVENFIATLLSAKTNLPISFQSYWVKWKLNASKFDCFEKKKCKFHLDGSNVCGLDARF